MDGKLPITLSYCFTAKPQGDTGHKSKGSAVCSSRASIHALHRGSRARDAQHTPAGRGSLWQPSWRSGRIDRLKSHHHLSPHTKGEAMAATGTSDERAFALRESSTRIGESMSTRLSSVSGMWRFRFIAGRATTSAGSKRPARKNAVESRLERGKTTCPRCSG